MQQKKIKKTTESKKLCIPEGTVVHTPRLSKIHSHSHTYFDSINFCDEGSNSSTSTCTPFPIVELTTACFKYFPDAPDGFSFVTTIIIARKLSSNFDCEKLTLPKGRFTGSLIRPNNIKKKYQKKCARVP